MEEQETVETTGDTKEDLTKEGHPSVPPVPPQTYRWEEIRRQKQLGIYPWTHILKPPFDLATWEKEKSRQGMEGKLWAEQKGTAPAFTWSDQEKLHKNLDQSSLIKT